MASGVSPFQKGRQYRVRKSFVSCITADQFEEGQILEFRDCVYSLYDGFTRFIFIKISDEKRLCWEIWDDECLDTWLELFEAV